MADHPADVRGGPEHLARLDAVEVAHRPFQRDHVAAIVAHDALGLAGRARGVEHVERIGRGDRHALGLARFGRARVADALVQSRSRPSISGASRCGRWKIEAGLRLVRGELDRLVEQRLVGDDAAPSMPQEAERMTFGLASSMRVASSLAAKPPNTTEWIAPMRAQASIANTASGIIGM